MAAVIPPPGGSVTRTPGTSAKKRTEEVRRSYIFISLRRKDFRFNEKEDQWNRGSGI
jgi:hypothetical protein